MATGWPRPPGPDDDTLPSNPAEIAQANYVVVVLVFGGVLGLVVASPVVAAVCFGAGAAVFWSTIRAARDRARWLRAGTRTSAEVVDVRWQWDVDRDGLYRHFVVAYRYHAGGSVRWGKRRLAWGRRVRLGDRLEILYDPRNPDVSAWFDDLPTETA